MEGKFFIQKNSSEVIGFVTKVYLWMGFGLALTFLTGLFVSNLIETNTNFEKTLTNILPLIFIGELLLVFAISAGVEKFNTVITSLLFLIYSIANGFFFGLIFSVYTSQSVIATFGVASITFIIMAMYGYATKQDLTKFGNLAIAGLIGFIVASVINLFVVSETLYWIITYFGIGIFIVLIAYDTQKIKSLVENSVSVPSTSIAIRGALSLYLDFINLFILLLRIFGERK